MSMLPPAHAAFSSILRPASWNEGRHVRPHFHARYAGAASIDLDGRLIAGSLPRRAQLLVAEWARLHRDELAANWERARQDQSLEPVEPLP
jgi:hypothetical protein